MQRQMSVNDKRIVFLIFVSLMEYVIPLDVIANYNEEVNRLTPPSPQAAIMQRFGEYPVDYCTGVPSINIPLYEIRIGAFSLPISISYHASGIKVQDVAGPVGLGWSLMAGGMINREVKHGIDYGSLDYKSEAEINALTSNLNDRYSTPWCVVAGDNGFDTETDRYTYTFNGKSGIFRHSADDNAIVKIPYSPIQIDEIPSGFRITDTDGVQYYFTVTETSRPDGGNFSVSSWLISKIVLAERTDSILFSYNDGPSYVMQSRNEYKDQGTVYHNTVGDNPRAPNYYSIHEAVNKTEDRSSTIYYHVTTKLLSSITWNGNSVLFTYSQRDDYQRGAARLSRLSLMEVRNSSSSGIRYIEFDNNAYFGSDAANYRLKLQSVCIKGNYYDTEGETYRFEYNSRTLPEYYQHISHMKCHEDYYGYYNGKNNVYWIPGEYKLDDGSAASDRSVDKTGSYSKACILEKITYPTGGWTEFDYEPNKVSDTSYVGGLRVKTIKNKDTNGQLTLKTYKYANPDVPIPIERQLYNYPVCFMYHLVLGIALPVTRSAFHFVAKSSPAIPLTGDYGCPVYYMTVTEFIGTESAYIGKTVFDYYEGRTSDISSYQDNGHDAELPVFYSRTYNYDMGMIKPVLYRKTVYDNSGSIQYKETNSYDEVLFDTIRLGVRFCNQVIVNETYYYVTGGDFRQYYSYSDVYAIPSYLRLSSRTIMKDGQSIVTNYSYDEGLRTDAPLAETTVIAGSGETYTTSYTYPFELTDSSIYDIMARRNFLVPIITTKIKNNRILDKTETHYRLYGNMCLPDYVSTAVGDEPLQKRIAYRYTTHGRPCFLQKDESDFVYFAWGSKKEYPYAKIEGLTEMQLKDVFGNNFYDLSSTLLTSEYSYLQQLGGHITLYNYISLVGLHSIASPNGIVQTFDYNSMGRLKDAFTNGHKTDTYEFHYRQ